MSHPSTSKGSAKTGGSWRVDLQVWDLGFRVEGSGFRDQGLGFSVYGFGFVCRRALHNIHCGSRFLVQFGYSVPQD